MKTSFIFSILGGALISLSFFWFEHELSDFNFQGKANRITDTLSDYSTDRKSLEKGKRLFALHCKSCHALKDDGIGPPLGGLTTIVAKHKLIKFTQNPASLLESKDRRWTLMLNRYKQIMPPYSFLKEQEIENIFAYIHNETQKQSIAPLTEAELAKFETGEYTGRVASLVVPSKYTINLQDFKQFPKAKENPVDKGISMLRSSPFRNGDFFITDLIGIIFKVHKGKIDTFLNVHSIIPNFIFAPGIGTGLGSFAFHPDFLKNGLCYTSHAEKFTGARADFSYADTLGPGLQWVITEWKMKDITSKKFKGPHRELMRVNTPTTAHGFQDITFSPVSKNNPDYGMLYIGSGDGGSNNIKRPDLTHNKQNLLGTIIRINPLGTNSRNKQYGVPPDNPFVEEDDSNTVKEIYAHGFRNPHRITWDKNNRMLVADIGEANVEELNVVVKGGDYGWPQREGDYRIDTRKTLRKIYTLTPQEKGKYLSPFAIYDHAEGRAISGGYVYQGKLKELQNKYIFGDIVTGKLYYVIIDANLSDPRVYSLAFTVNQEPANATEMYGKKMRAQLRVAYDEFTKEMYVMNKSGIMRKITAVSVKSEGYE